MGQVLFGLVGQLQPRLSHIDKHESFLGIATVLGKPQALRSVAAVFSWRHGFAFRESTEIQIAEKSSTKVQIKRATLTFKTGHQPWKEAMYRPPVRR